MAELERFASDADPSSPHRILLLTGVAGCGKTAIAQSAAKLFDHSDWTRPRLGACFNFSAQVEDRRTPRLLFTTVAFSLGGPDPNLKASITGALTDNPLLASSASLVDQFSKLVNMPLRVFTTSTSHRIVIVIDALDEVDTDALNPLLDLLAEDFSQLPVFCRVIVTSRPDSRIIRCLVSVASRHIVLQKIDLHDQKGLDDLRRVARYRLNKIAESCDLGLLWPGSEREERFIRKAGGLFIWLDVACKTIQWSEDPTDELERVLEGDETEPDMDILYRQILDACWSRKGFALNYRLVVGTVLALKTPLSTPATQQLIGSLLQGTKPRVNDVLEPLASIILLNASSSVSSSAPTQRLEISHESFRAFATQKNPEAVPEVPTRYLIDEVEASQRLALRCLLILNNELPRHAALTKVLFPDTKYDGDVPSLDDGVVSEVLEYACDHWMAHLSTVMEPEIGLLDVLRDFLRSNLVVWMQLCACRGKFQGIEDLRTWLAKSLHNADIDLATGTDRDTLSRCLDQLEGRMRYSGRLEEALTASKLWVEVERGFESETPVPPTASLAKALHWLSACYQELGRREDALGVVQVAVEIRRQLAAERPAEFDSDLARSLQSLSITLGQLGRPAEALSVIQESVDIRRQLAAARPAAFNSDLAYSLHSLSIYLNELGRPEEALKIIQESVDIRRQLAAARPAAFNSDLADSLHQLSVCLHELGRTEEAPSVDNEVVDILRQLARELPARFNSDLAESLYNMSLHLSKLGHKERALDAIQEALPLYRQLAVKIPARYTSELADALNRLANCLDDLGRDDEAAAAREDREALL